MMHSVELAAAVIYQHESHVSNAILEIKRNKKSRDCIIRSKNVQMFVQKNTTSCATLDMGQMKA